MALQRESAHLHVELDLLPKAPLREHAKHRLLNNTLRDARLKLLERLLLHGTRETVDVALVELIVKLATSHGDLLGVNNNKHGTHVHGGCVGGGMLATDVARGEARQAAERLVLCVDDVPVCEQ